MSNQYSGEQSEGQQHPPEYRDDLNPSASALEQIAGSAAELKPLTRELSDLPRETLERIPVVQEGSRLKQGSTYLDLTSPQMGEIVATGEMKATRGSRMVPKARTDYETWNLLMARLGLAA